MLLWEALRRRGERPAKTQTQPQPEQTDGKPRPTPKPAQPTAPKARRLPHDTRCAALTQKGTRCHGRIRKGTDFCPFHDPHVSAKQRRLYAAKGGRSHHRFSRLPDGYLRRLKTETDIGHAMDRLYREVRLGTVGPEMGMVMLNILNRLLDSGMVKRGLQKEALKAARATKAVRLRPKLTDLLTRAEKSAWRKAVAKAPAAFLRADKNKELIAPNPQAAPRPQPDQKPAPEPTTRQVKLAPLTAAS